MVSLIPVDWTKCCHLSKETRNKAYRGFTLILTFLAYTSYHLSRKPISVVKPVLHQNCTNQNGTTESPQTCSSWAPFDQDNYKQLEGSLDSVYLFAYAFGMFFSGHIAERINLAFFLSGGMFLSGVFTALFGIAYYANIHSLAYFIAIQFFGGLFQSSGWPSVVTCVANWFGKGRRGLIMGIWNSHTSFGNILGSVIAGYFVEDEWGLSFIVPGAIIAGLGIFVLFFLVPRPQDIGCEPPIQGTPMPDGSHQPLLEENSGTYNVNHDVYESTNEIASNSEEQEVESHRIQVISSNDAISFFGALKIPGVIEFSLCLFFAKFVSYTFLYWLPQYIEHSTSFDATESADLSTLFDFGGILGGIVAGIIADATSTSAMPCVIMLTCAAPMMFIYVTYGGISLTWSIVLLLITGFFVNGPYALITTAVSADLGTHDSLHGNARALATVTAIIDGTGSFGAALGPLFAGFVSPHGWQDVFYMLIAADGLALLMLLRLVIKEVRRVCCWQRQVEEILVT